MGASPRNEPVPNIPFFYPKAPQPVGSVLKLSSETPTLFTPLKIRGAIFQNRIMVAPMCSYSAAPNGPQVGALTPFHIATLGQYAMKGAALVFIEASGVTPEGRITPNDSGLYTDEQQAAIKGVADHVHATGGKIGIQLFHAGRKASTVAPWLSKEKGALSIVAGEDVGGWPEDVWAPSPIPWAAEGFAKPKELSRAQIKSIVQAFADSAKRAVAAGVDVIELHGAHGYLVHEFVSPLTNHRTDEYGGSFENRIRFPVEIIKAVRSVIPADTPLFYRISATEWMEDQEEGKTLGTWTVDDSIRFAKLLPELGVDLLDVSSGGNHEKQGIKWHTTYQSDIAGQIRRAVQAENSKLLIGAVGMITDAEQARNIVDGKQDARPRSEAEQARDLTEGHRSVADVVLIGRQFMREPEWVLRTAWKLGVEVAWPVQYGRARFTD